MKEILLSFLYSFHPDYITRYLIELSEIEEYKKKQEEEKMSKAKEEKEDNEEEKEEDNEEDNEEEEDDELNVIQGEDEDMGGFFV